MIEAQILRGNLAGGRVDAGKHDAAIIARSFAADAIAALERINAKQAGGIDESARDVAIFQGTIGLLEPKLC
jgi:hypothetical protein